MKICVNKKLGCVEIAEKGSLNQRENKVLGTKKGKGQQIKDVVKSLFRTIFSRNPFQDNLLVFKDF